VDGFDTDLGAGVRKRAGAANRVAPDPDKSGFFPIRAGHLQFLELRVVDAFCQVQEVFPPDTNPPLVCSTPMKTEGYPTFAELPPRITQPSRLAFRYVSARNSGDSARDANRSAAETPIAGWLLPNRLDASLMVYDADGAAQGELQLIDGSLGPTGAGVRWVPAPGQPVTYGAPPDLAPHMQQLATTLLALSTGGTNALAQLLQVIDEGLTTVNPLGSYQDQSLASLMGRPLALVRARLGLDLTGDPVFDQRWQALRDLLAGQGFEDGGLTGTPFGVALGNSELTQDGLIGYFLGDDYTRFYLAQYGVAPPQGTYVVRGAPIPLTADPTASPVMLTMIVDPRADIHATTGILPTKAIGLPPDQTAAALGAMDVTFMAGPLVTDSKILAVPVPGGKLDDWSWLSHPSPSVWSEVPQLAPVDATAHLASTPQQISDGWMKRSAAFAPKRGRGNGRGSR
jgi:hypothetical protein